MRWFGCGIFVLCQFWSMSFIESSKRTLLVLVLLVSVLSLQFYKPSTKDYVKELNSDFVRSFENDVRILHQITSEARGEQVESSVIKAQLKSTRRSYKKLEFLLEYYYPEYVEEHINGAPLLHIEQFDTKPMVVPPEGLQVLDEMIFTDDWQDNIHEIDALALKLEMQASFMLKDFEGRPLNSADIINASRLEIIRIASMSITGFDTPGSLNGLEESQIALESIHQYLKPIMANSEEPVYNQIEVLLEKGEEHLQGQNFDNFDRLTFTKEVLDPLYKAFTRLADYDYPHSKTAWNPRSESIFANDLLNPYFYTSLSADEDSDELRNLGKKIFYDPLISGNSQMSCVTCHDPKRAFTDGQKRSISSVEGKTVDRNAPTLINAVYSDRYFYDLRAYTLEQQAQHVIFNPDEFNTANAEILEKLNHIKDYKVIFNEIFGSKEINERQFSQALASYVMSLRGFNSEFDKYMRGESQQLNTSARRGYNLFMGKATCGTCHFAPTFSGLVPPNFVKNETEILGVLKEPGEDELDDDRGRINNKIFAEEAWIYERSFKTSTIRNVELTGPYFHNGEFETLKEVMDFYNHGGGAGLGLEVTNQTLAGDSLHLSETEMEDIISFMKSLTDTTLNY